MPLAQHSGKDNSAEIARALHHMLRGQPDDYMLGQTTVRKKVSSGCVNAVVCSGVRCWACASNCLALPPPLTWMQFSPLIARTLSKRGSMGVLFGMLQGPGLLPGCSVGPQARANTSALVISRRLSGRNHVQSVVHYP